MRKEIKQVLIIAGMLLLIAILSRFKIHVGFLARY